MLISVICLCLAAAAPLGRADDTTLPVPEPISEPSTVITGAEPSTVVTRAVSETTAEPMTTQPAETQSTTAKQENEFPMGVTIPNVLVEAMNRSLNISRSGIDTKLWNQVRDVLEHFRTPGAVGFPGQTALQDPLLVPNQTISMGLLGYSNFYHMSVHGLSNFTVEGVNTRLDELEVYTIIKIKEVHIIGNCSVVSHFGLTTHGPFNITLRNVTAEGTVYLMVNPNGKLQANRSVSAMEYEELTVASNANVGMQTALNTVASGLFATLRPFILGQIDERINQEVNAQLQKSPPIPNIVNRSPVDLAISEGRKLVQKRFEPFQIDKLLEHDSEFLAVSLGPVNVSGLSNFARVGGVTLKVTNGTIVIGLRMITGPLVGHGKFSYDFGKVGAARHGEANFSLAHLQFEAKVNQSLDFRKKPILDDLQLETGRILVQMDGKGGLDYLLETALDLLPQMFRYMIIDALEEPIKQMIQTHVLDKLNVEELFDHNLKIIAETLLSS